MYLAIKICICYNAVKQKDNSIHVMHKRTNPQK